MNKTMTNLSTEKLNLGNQRQMLHQKTLCEYLCNNFSDLMRI